MQRISCLKVAPNFLLRLSVGNVGRMNTQIRLLNSLVRLQAGWTVNSLVRCVTRNGWFWFQYTMSKCLLKCLSFCLFFLLATESHNSNRRVPGNYSPCQNRRMFENKIYRFSSHVDFIVNQICRFASTMKKKPRANFTVASNSHPEEQGPRFFKIL